MTGNDIIDEYAAELSEQIPRHAVEEMVGGLEETYVDHLDRESDQDAAARAAIAEFGQIDAISRAFVRHGPGRRVAKELIASGPLIGLTWAAALIGARAWNWPVTPEGIPILAGALAMTVTLLFLGLQRDSLWWSWLAPLAACLMLASLDGTMILVTLGVGQTHAPLFAVAMAASSLRILHTTASTISLLRHRPTRSVS